MSRDWIAKARVREGQSLREFKLPVWTDKINLMVVRVIPEPDARKRFYARQERGWGR